MVVENYEVEYIHAINQDLEKHIEELNLDRSNFLGGRTKHIKPDNQGFPHVDQENMVIEFSSWMRNVLSFDDFTTKVNKRLDGLYKEQGMLFDYTAYDILQGELELEEQESFYTYNDPDNIALSHAIHCTIFESDAGTYALFNIHIGADARAGFTIPICYAIDGNEDDFLMSMTLSADIDSNDSYYDSIEVWEVPDIAEFNKETQEWETPQGDTVYINANE